MSSGHGGSRPGAGRKKRPLAEKLLEGNRGHEKLTYLKLDGQQELPGEDMPPIAEYLTQVTKNSNQNLAPQIYESTWKWLHERGCDLFVKKELIEQYALYITRWIQCEEGINQYGLLAKHPTTQMPIASPYVSMGLNFLKQANILWMQIFQIVKENCSVPLDSNPNDDLMEQILKGNI